METKQIIRVCWKQARKVASLEWGWYGRSCFGWNAVAHNQMLGGLINAGINPAVAIKLANLYVN